MSNALIPTGCLPSLSKTNKFLPGMLIIKTQFPLFNRYKVIRGGNSRERFKL